MITAIAILAAASFTPPCPLPFAKIAKRQPVDSKCGVPDGNTTVGKQDQIKDNFCAKGTPVVLTYEVYPILQSAAVELLGPRYAPPADRSKLKNIVTWKGKKIGEGTVVTLVAFVDRARYSDVDTGESVNCDLHGDADNDVHIPLLQTAGDSDECHSVTAEISPHYRPDAWTPENLNKIKNPVRMTGQLFFDASHKPCSATMKEEPLRQSVWEIHPIYSVDVCVNSSISACDPNTAKNWTPLK
jgi:hypothetical protein